jgi:hypothetical protein
MAEKNLPNLRVLTGILLNGEHVEAGTVLSKADLEKTDWQNLVFGFGDNPRLAETSDRVGQPDADEEDEEPAPAAKGKAAMPGAAT